MSSSILDLLGQGSPAARRGAGDAGSFVQGTVTENNEKKFPGMVKVEFTSWANGKNICQWIPLLHSYAGPKYGQYVLPEIGDTVVIGFMGAAQKRPFVLGVLYPADSAFARESFEPKNLTRRFKTKGGLDFTLSDEQGKETITAETPKGLRVTVSDESQSITLQDKDGKNKILLDSKGGEVQLLAEKTITLTAGKCQITLDGNSGAITIKGDRITVDASQMAKVAAKQSLNLEGGMLKAEGKQTATIKGGAMTQVSGQILKLN